MPARENLPQQVWALTETYRLLLREGDITRANLKTKLVAAQAVVEDGSEINALSFEGGSQQAEVTYPKEVVLTACLTILNESDPANLNPNGSADPSVVHADLSQTRIES